MTDTHVYAPFDGGLFAARVLKAGRTTATVSFYGNGMPESRRVRIADCRPMDASAAAVFAAEDSGMAVVAR